MRGLLAASDKGIERGRDVGAPSTGGRHRSRLGGGDTAGRRRGLPVEFGLLEDYRFLELPQLRGGIDSQLLTQVGSEPSVGVQGIGLAAGAIQRQHQLGPAPLAQRFGCHRRLQITDHRRVLTQAQTSLYQLLLARQVQLDETAGLRHPYRLVGEVYERLSPP